MAPPRPQSFRCRVSRGEEGARVRAAGELDIATVPIVEAEITALRAAGVRHVTLDLSELAFIDSTGLRCILETDAEARRDGFSIALVAGPPAVHRVFTLTRHESYLPFAAP